MATEAFAPAKINLTLHVTGQRSDGYHLLDSLVVFADVGDRIVVSAAEEMRLTVSGPMAAGVPLGPDNLVRRAADLIGVTADIHLEKHLPVAAGIGGGSSDAAAVLRALSAMSGAELPPDVMTLGADVPVCLRAEAARMQGVGEVVAPMSGLPELQAVLINPGFGVATPEVFRALTNKNNPAMAAELPQWRDAASLVEWLATQRNDLEAPAMALAPAIGEILHTLHSTAGCRLARMSGSGATCFGLFDTLAVAKNAASALAAAHPRWWVSAVTLQ